MIFNSQHALLDLKPRFENTFTNLPISVISHNMAILEAEEHPIAFEFITNTVIDLKKRQISTFISEIEATIPGIIILDCGNVISQHINITCEYEILTLTQLSIEKLLLEPNPILTYSEWSFRRTIRMHPTVYTIFKKH